MTVSRIRRVASPREMEAVIDDFVTQGYTILTLGENSVMLRKRSWGSAIGHLLCAMFLGIFTLGFANLFYAIIAHYGAEKVMIKVEQV